MAKETNGALCEDENHQLDDDSEARADIWKYVFGFTEIAVVKCAIELGIADILEKHQQQPVTLSQLCAELGCSSSHFLYRILRFLTNRGIFKETLTKDGEEIGYVQTPLSRLLRRESGNSSMAAFVLFESSPIMLAPWHKLSARILSKENNIPAPFDASHGKDIWKYVETDLGHNELLNKAMACDARVAISAIINGCPEIFEGISSVVDVGGGDGTALGMLVEAFPWIITGINFDLPHVASLVPHNSLDGVQHVGGDMFHYVPKADVAFLMWVLHDWGDEECIEILKKCGEAIPKDKGKVIIVEAVIGENIRGKANHDKLKDVGLMLDMVMMAHTSNGKERTSKEWAYVLSSAGFSRHTIHNINAVQSVIQAYP